MVASGTPLHYEHYWSTTSRTRHPSLAAAVETSSHAVRWWLAQDTRPASAPVVAPSARCPRPERHECVSSATRGRLPSSGCHAAPLSASSRNGFALVRVKSGRTNVKCEPRRFQGV